MKCLHCRAEIVGRHKQARYCTDACGSRARCVKFALARPERIVASRRHAESKRENYMLARAKHRAKRFGIKFNIELPDIVIPALCPVLGIPLYRGKKGNCPNAPSLDRIDPLRGYVKGNVRVISQRANLLKSNASELELSAVLMDARHLQENVHAAIRFGVQRIP